MRHARLNRIARDPTERLRRLRGEVAPEPDRVREAVKRVLQTADGQVMLEWMVAKTYGFTVPSSAPDSALRENEARKRFLNQFLALAEEPSESAQASTGAEP